MILQLRRLSTGLLGLSIILLLAALLTNKWDCGFLLGHCLSMWSKPWIQATAGCLIIGLLLLGLVFVVDVAEHFLERAGRRTLCFTRLRYVLICLAATACLVGVMAYTGGVGSHWSYFLAVVGAVSALHVAVLSIFTARCIASGSLKQGRLKEADLAARL